MGDERASGEALLAAVVERAGLAKVAIEGLPASPGHIEAYDILCEVESVDLDGLEGLLSRLKGALVGRPMISQLISVEFGEF